MTDDALADFNAELTLSKGEAVDSASGRVVVGDRQLVLASEDVRETIPLPDVFDIAQDVSAGAPPDAPAAVTLGYERGESRETATIECRAATLAKFQLVVFKLLLNGTEVTVKQTGRGQRLDETVEDANLSVRSDGIVIEYDGGELRFSRDAIEAFETSLATGAGGGSQPRLTLVSTHDGPSVKTLIRLPSFKQLNLFGRFLQSSPDAGRETTKTTAPSTIDVLVVDDDPRDLDTIQLMLNRVDERITVTNATSAPGGMEALESDSFDCVVSDYDMPGSDGIDFLESVRERYPALPFILFTGQGSEAVAKQAILGDATDYVEKGIGSEQYEILATRIGKAVR